MSLGQCLETFNVRYCLLLNNETENKLSENTLGLIWATLSTDFTRWPGALFLKIDKFTNLQDVVVDVPVTVFNVLQKVREVDRGNLQDVANL